MKHIDRHRRINGFNWLILCCFLVVSSAFCFLPAVSWADRGSTGHSRKGKRLSVYDKVGDWKLQRLNGKEISFSDCKGEVIFLNFWATWCMPCVEEMPSIAKLLKSFEKDAVTFMLVSNEKEETIRAFIEKHNIDLPIYISRENPKFFRSKRLPLTFIIDRNGGVTFRCTGSNEWHDTGYQELIKGIMER